MRSTRPALLLLPAAILCFAGVASAGWDPLQKAERAAARGARLLAEGDSLGAINAYLEAQALRPNDERIRMGLGGAFFENGEFKSASAQFRQLSAESESMRLEALYNAGNAAAAQGELEQALDYYTQALVAGSTDPDLLFNLELAQKMLEQAQEQQGEPQDSQGDEQQSEDEQQDSEQQEQQQQEQQQQESGEEEQEPQDSERESEEQDQEQQEPELPDPAAGDSTATAEPDTLFLPPNMTLAEALQLLDALDHDEEELRRSILRRLRASDTESEHDW